MTSTVTSAALAVILKVIKFGFTDYKVDKKSGTAVCKFCKSESSITDKIGTTSNFIRHLNRLHDADSGLGFRAQATNTWTRTQTWTRDLLDSDLDSSPAQ